MLHLNGGMALENLKELAVGSTVSACGEDGSGRTLCASGETGLSRPRRGDVDRNTLNKSTRIV